jgi:hypothetical protein
MTISAIKPGRERSGRKSRRKADASRRDAETAEAARSVVVEARLRQGIPLKWATDPRAGTIQGRLHIAWQADRRDPYSLDEDQFEAADWYLVQRNYYLIAINATAAHYDADDSNLGLNDPEAHERFCKGAIGKWQEIMRALGDMNVQGECRWNLLGALNTLLVQQAMVPRLTGDLRIALNVVHRLKNGT